MLDGTFRDTSASVYMIMLACGDTVVLIVGLIPELLDQLHVMSLWEENEDDQGCPHLSQVTILCLSCAVAFLILNLPSIILFIGKIRWRGNDWYPLARAIMSQLTYIHHAINPVLYSLFGKRFRATLVRIFRT
ncbi:hypothetical protein LSH36_450g02094 [Paralvinella palmiformis]|uniref:G-protein coupled receptors family 1 profile domain-containing protein n=1 Tax=Paralvinella palmiformis TaxID=53620 RepID=A0AAD9JAF1_9ANNE|nr:hypothetical protein LSH36_450g02094 [Paralvinella palmiformis]